MGRLAQNEERVKKAGSGLLWLPSRPFFLTGGGSGTFVWAKKKSGEVVGSGKVVVAFPHCLLYQVFLLTGGGSGGGSSVPRR